jgi:hypothetical protein
VVVYRAPLVSIAEKYDDFTIRKPAPPRWRYTR